MSKLQVDDIVNKDDTGGVGFSKGVVVTGITTATSFDGDLTGNADTATYAPTAGIATYAPTAGIATNAQGLTGTPDVVVGVATATKFTGGNLEVTTITADGGVGAAGSALVSTGSGLKWGPASQFTAGGAAAIFGYRNGDKTVINDGANGRLDLFGTGNFMVFTSPGTFETAGISSIRVRVVGAGGHGLGALPTGLNGGGGAGSGGGGGYAHKVINSPDFPSPGSYAVVVGEGGGGDATGTSSIAGVAATAGQPAVGPAPAPTPGGGGGATGGDVNYTGAAGFGVPQGQGGNGTAYGGAAGTQLGNTTSGQHVPGTRGYDTQPAIRLFSNYVERFPFDIFVGLHGLPFTSNNTSAGGMTPHDAKIYNVGKDGFGGGAGGGYIDNTNTSPSTGVTGGNGGHGAGGGGNVPQTGITGGGGNGGYGGGGGGGGVVSGTGQGGPGIVIVEW